jgi:hypothetical protein
VRIKLASHVCNLEPGLFIQMGENGCVRLKAL